MCLLSSTLYRRCGHRPQPEVVTQCDAQLQILQILQMHPSNEGAAQEIARLGMDCIHCRVLTSNEHDTHCSACAGPILADINHYCTRILDRLDAAIDTHP